MAVNDARADIREGRQPYRVVVIRDDRNRTATTVVVTLDESPEIGSSLHLPQGDTVIVRHVVPGYGDLTGVILAATS